MLVDLADGAVLGEAEHAQAVVPVAGGDQQLRVVRQDEESGIDFVVGRERSGERLFGLVAEQGGVPLEREEVGRRALVGLPAVHAYHARLADAQERIGQALLHEGFDVVAWNTDVKWERI